MFGFGYADDPIGIKKDFRVVAYVGPGRRAEVHTSSVAAVIKSQKWDLERGAVSRYNLVINMRSGMMSEQESRLHSRSSA